MMTTDLLNSIEIILPGAGSRCHFRRRVVRLLADVGGMLPEAHLMAALGAAISQLGDLIHDWDGLRVEGSGPGRLIRLAPWLRRALGLPVTREELLADLDGDDEGEPTAYHRPVCHEDESQPGPVIPGGLDPLAGTWTIEELWELANVVDISLVREQMPLRGSFVDLAR